MEHGPVKLPDIECVPPGDFAYLKLRKSTGGKGHILVFTWEQVERGDQTPMFKFDLSQQEMLNFSRALLQLAGSPLYKDIVVPENTWGGKQNEKRNST